MDEAHQKLLKRIGRWQFETALYRVWNIIFFLSAKIIVPTFSAVIVANLSVASATTAAAFISDKTMIILGIVIAVLSGLDSFFNPSLQKFRAHRKNIELSKLKEQLEIEWAIANDDVKKSEVLKKASSHLNEVLTKYAQEAYGNNLP